MSNARSRRSGDRVRVLSGTSGNTLTRQSFAPECDVNKILKKFLHTGVMPRRSGDPFYGDFSAADDYQSSLNKVMQAEDSFMELPSELRKRFKNDPYEFLAFVGNSANRDEAIELGLINKPEDIGHVENVNAEGEVGSPNNAPT